MRELDADQLALVSSRSTYPVFLVEINLSGQELLSTNGFGPQQEESLVQELNELWALRFVRLQPAIKHEKPLVEPRAAF